jgi:hypothetical protein
MCVRRTRGLWRLPQRPDLDNTVSNSAWRCRHELSNLLDRRRLDDREPRYRESGRHEGSTLHDHASTVVVSHLHGRTGDPHVDSRRTQAGVMRVRLVPYRRVGAIVAFLIAVADGHEFGIAA